MGIIDFEFKSNFEELDIWLKGNLRNILVNYICLFVFFYVGLNVIYFKMLCLKKFKRVFLVRII